MIPARGNSDNGGYINMQHSHTIIDKDNHFIINPVTRKIQPETHEKNKLVEGDHNSEKYTFEIPKTIEGHDMSQCNIVRINYLNISSDKSKKSEDVYEVDDLGILEDKPDILAFTWTIKETATRYSGLLSFAITFKCTTDNLVDYAWHTEIYSAISIGIGMDNSEIIVTEYSDILDKWKKELFAIDGTIQTTARKSLEEIENAKNASLNSIAQHGTVQVSNEEPTDPNVDLFINPDETVSISVPEINDESVSDEDTWSSAKIDKEFQSVNKKQMESDKETAKLKEDLAKHPDWNQNDESAPDYVKGRTHYEESACVDYVLNMDGTNIAGLSIPEVGETMTVKINGVESAETVKKAYSNDAGSYKYIGNIDVDSLLNGGTGWVIIMLYGDKAVGFANPDTTISIEVAIIHKINEKFINFDGFVRTFNYCFKGHSLYKILYKDNGSECLLYMCDNFILPEEDSMLFGFMGEIGFSAVGSFSEHSCFVTGYEINNIGNINISQVVLGTDTAEMEELAAGYGYTHNTNPNA